MADTNEKYFPFRSVAGDRKYSAEDWAAYFALFLSNGVFYSSADKLKVVANEGMKVKVNKGAAFINGRGYRLEADTTITLDTADGVLKRIDRIVLRCDYANRLITIVVKKGSYSQEPVAVELTRDADVYELALADIYVAAGVVEITTANITDQRLNTSLCGIVTGLVDQADTTEIFNQFQAYMLEFAEAKEEEFQIWFNTIKTTLEGDVAGNLQNQITSLQNQTGNISELKTENKTDLVAAINELSEKEPDLLETMEEVEANTETGKHVDALVFKELNDSLTAEDSLKFQFATDGEGNYGYLKGDDTFVPFKSGLSLPFYLLSGTKAGTEGYKYIPNSLTGATYGIYATLWKLNLSGVSKISAMFYGSGNTHFSISKDIPTSLADMQNAEYYQAFTISGTITNKMSKEFDLPIGLDNSADYYLTFYSEKLNAGTITFLALV